MTMSLPLTFGSGRTALVTGAGRGIGRQIAETLGRGGVSHIICVSRSGCENVVESIKREGRERGEAIEASSYTVDVGDGDAVLKLCDELISKHKTIDILINNAGITKDNLFLRMKPNEWNDVINVNLNSAFYFTNRLIREMIKAKFGRIINMASVVGIGGNVGQANYAASKAALIGFTKSVAKEVAKRGITVNAIAPGFIHSDMTDAMTEEAKAKTISLIPAGRMGTAQEVADLAAFLASDNSAYINGKVMPIDGAMLFGGN